MDERTQQQNEIDQAFGLSDDYWDQSQLAAHWRMSPRTLEAWRRTGRGPAFLKLGRVIYRRVDIEAYEREHLRGLRVSRSEDGDREGEEAELNSDDAAEAR